MIRHVLAMLLMVGPALAQDAGLEAWTRIHEVFSHPRCANCHVGPDNVPMWSGLSYGPKARPHGMNIKGGASRKGAEYIACTACHTHHNSQVPHGPPGAHVWQLPPASMQWFASRAPRSALRSKTRPATAHAASPKSPTTSSMMRWFTGAGRRDPDERLLPTRSLG